VRSVRRILLASHGTAGARAAEAAAFDFVTPDAVLGHLVVVPDLWRGMMGDDWLNNASTRDRYARHLEGELGREIEALCARLETEVRGREARYVQRTAVGDPAACLVAYAAEFGPDLVVIGARRPPRVEGLRSRMRLERLTTQLAAPLLVAPYPR
jgi:nucleotide-binding universal stress UspA family protein